jgi:hypothetical protein
VRLLSRTNSEYLISTRNKQQRYYHHLISYVQSASSVS